MSTMNELLRNAFETRTGRADAEAAARDAEAVGVTAELTPADVERWQALHGADVRRGARRPAPGDGGAREHSAPGRPPDANTVLRAAIDAARHGEATVLWRGRPIV